MYTVKNDVPFWLMVFEEHPASLQIHMSDQFYLHNLNRTDIEYHGNLLSETVMIEEMEHY